MGVELGGAYDPEHPLVGGACRPTKIIESYDDNQPVRDEVLRATPMRRYGTGDDVGGAVAYLASDLASWVTGQTLAVNGGYFTT